MLFKLSLAYIVSAFLSSIFKYFVLSEFAYGMGLAGGSHSKESACNAGDLGLIPGLGGSPGEGNGYPL